MRGVELYQAERIAHAPAGHHAACDAGGLFDIAFGPGRAGAVDDLLGGAAAENTGDTGAQIGFRIVVAVAVGPLIGHPEGLAARHDGHPVDRIGAGDHQAEDGVAAFVIGDALLVGAAEEDRALRSEDDLFKGIHQVLAADRLLAAFGGEQSRFVDEIPEVGP